MSRLFKRWWMLVAAMMTALAVVVAGAVPALAAEPGESSSWSSEFVNNGAVLHSPDTYSEAYGGQTGALVQIFRGEDDHVWIGVDNGPIFNAGGGNNTTTTHVAPRVIYSNGWFYAFQTGTDGRIYWSRAFDGRIGSNTPSVSQSFNWSNWEAIAGNPATTQSVSVASAPGFGLLMTWLAVNGTNMYSAWLPEGSDTFDATRIITNSNSDSAPVVTFNPRTNTFDLAFRGLLNNTVYITSQVLGQTTWAATQALPGITTRTSPTIAANANGDLLLAANDFDGNVWFQAVNNQGATTGWSEESAHEQTGVPIWLSVLALNFVAVVTTTAGIVQWKGAWDSSKGI
jgi:hypothetical protein